LHIAILGAVPTPRPDPQLFGDLLALARLRWIRDMAERLAQRGYSDYHRADALVFRFLLREPAPVGRLAGELGVTRQAARKVVAGLEERELACTERDEFDTRRVNVALTPAGATYARAVIAVLRDLNRELVDRVDPAELAAAESVLRSVIGA
jgi:DNA-binding MarR family transcriptional regulator